MKYYAIGGKKKLQEVDGKLTSLDRAILRKCSTGMNIVRVIKAGKPYFNKHGHREFATTEEVMSSVSTLLSIGVLERR